MSVEKGRIVLEDKPIPDIGPQDAPIRVTATSICGTDVRAALRVLRPGGVLSSLGVYSSDLKIPLDAFAAGLGDKSIRTSLCPGGKERMRRMLGAISAGRVDLGGLVTHRFKLDQIEAAYELFANQRYGVLKVAITT